jgi:hypothetical protein
MSGTTIYGSTAVCSAVGKFTSCIDAGSGNFSGNVNTGILVGNTVGDGNAEYQFVTGASTNTRSGIAIKDSWNGVNNNNAYVKLFVGTGSGTINALSINYLGVATFSSTITGTTIYGSTAVCSPVGKFTTCLDLGGALTGTSGTFSGILSSSGGDIRSSGTAADSVTAGPFISIRNASNAHQYLLQLNATYGLDFWTFGGTWNKRMTLDASGRLIVGSGITANGASIQTSGDIRADYSSAIYLQINGGADGDYRKGFSGINQETGVARGLHIFNYDPDSSQGIKFFGGTYAAKARFGGFDSGGNFFVNSADSAEGYKLYVNGTIGITGAATFSGNISNSGNLITYKSGGGGNSKQVVVGQTTAAASGTAKKIAYVGYSHSVRVYVWANQNASNGSSAIADFTTLYGASSGGTTSESNFGNVSDIVVAYDNGGSPAYTINVTLVYTGTAPTINYIVEGINNDNSIYAI